MYEEGLEARPISDKVTPCHGCSICDGRLRNILAEILERPPLMDATLVLGFDLLSYKLVTL